MVRVTTEIGVALRVPCNKRRDDAHPSLKADALLEVDGERLVVLAGPAPVDEVIRAHLADMCKITHNRGGTGEGRQGGDLEQQERVLNNRKGDEWVGDIEMRPFLGVEWSDEGASQRHNSEGSNKETNSKRKCSSNAATHARGRLQQSCTLTTDPTSASTAPMNGV